MINKTHKELFSGQDKTRIKEKWWFSQCGRTWLVCRKQLNTSGVTLKEPQTHHKHQWLYLHVFCLASWSRSPSLQFYFIISKIVCNRAHFLGRQCLLFLWWTRQADFSRTSRWPVHPCSCVKMSLTESVTERIILVNFERFSGNDPEEVSEMNWNGQHYSSGLYYPALPSPLLQTRPVFFLRLWATRGLVLGEESWERWKDKSREEERTHPCMTMRRAFN